MNLVLRNWPIVIFLVIAAYLARNYFNHGLQKYPGPFLASFTGWWRFFDVLGRRPDITHNKLHQKYGSIVRLAPNMLSISDYRALKSIYGLNKGFIKVSDQHRTVESSLIARKSDFYAIQAALSNGAPLPSLFSTTDEKYHADLRKSVNSAFSMTALVQYEPSVSEATAKFLDQTEALFVSKNADCDFAEWLQFLAFDVIGQITYSKRHGFVDRGEDVDGMVGYLGRLFSYIGPIGMMPILDRFLLKNPLLCFLDKHGIMSFTFPVVTFAKARMAERLEEMRAIKAKGENPATITDSGRGDLLSMFLKAKEDRPDFFHDRRVLTMAVSMAFAGSETTAISLAAVFYYLLKNRGCYDRLMSELDEAIDNGTIENRSDGLVSWAESQRLPYLDAVVKEAFRLHPAPGLPLERIVPKGGVEVCGEMIPGGTIVGCNPWVIHRQPEVFGKDVEAFRPERWLDVDKETRKKMEGCMLQFGQGARTCIGKNISLLEIYKAVPSFLRRFEIALVNPEKEWKLHNAWFVKQKNFYTTFKPRRMIQAHIPK